MSGYNLLSAVRKRLTVFLDYLEKKMQLVLVSSEQATILLNKSHATFSVIIDDLQSVDNF
jgi:hypothetical protein